jgi:putative transposase
LLTNYWLRTKGDRVTRAREFFEFVERLWRTVKYEDIYLWRYETVAELRQGLGRYFPYYNEGRPHQALGYRTPATVYRQERAGGKSAG